MNDRVPWIVGATVIGLAAAALWASEADAQEAPCKPAAQFIAELKKDYGEVKIGGGEVGEIAIVGLYASPGGETWTILRLMPNGQACGLAAGKNLVMRPIPVKGEDA